MLIRMTYSQECITVSSMGISMGAKFKNVSGGNFVVPELAGYVVADDAECDLMDDGLPVFYDNFDAAKYVFETAGCSVKDGIDASDLQLIDLTEPPAEDDLLA